jgi:hypothetical protein
VAAEMRDRMEMTLEISLSHSDYFVRNLVAIGAEKRLALMVKRQNSLPGAKRFLRHLVAVSAPLHANGTAGQTFLMHLDAETKDLAWATVVSLLGLPADPRWGELILGEARKEKRMRRLEGIGCNPAVVLGTREDFMLGIRHARSLGRLPFPENNSPIVWPQYTIRNALVLTRSLVQRRSAF